MKDEKLHILIINWNGLNDTIACIDSIFATDIEDFKIVLTDNNSDNQEFELLQKKYSSNKNITFVQNDSNIGFTKASNQSLSALLKLESSFVFLLNNDAVLESNTLKRINSYSLKEINCCVSFKLLNYYNRERIDNLGHQFVSSGEILPIANNELSLNYSKSFNNHGACAGACLYSTKMLRDIGLFDEYFDTGYEDAELGLRAFVAGYQPIFDPNLIVYHKVSQSIDKVFDYQFALKTQVNIHYTYLKLVHWQVLAINYIPNLIRFLLISLINILFLRFKYLRIQYHALFIIFLRDWKIVMNARKQAKSLRRIQWWEFLKKQEFVLFYDIKRFYKFIIKGQKSYFEKY
jgi:GT2 family glycosyltransferase